MKMRSSRLITLFAAAATLSLVAPSLAEPGAGVLPRPSPASRPTVDPRGVRPLPGPLASATLAPPEVHLSADSAGTAATDATFSTRLAGTSFEWSFGGGAVPDRATTTTATSPRVVLGRPGTYTVRVTARGAAPREASASYPVRAFASTSSTLMPAMRARGGWNTYSLLALPSGETALVQCMSLTTGVLGHYLRLFIRRGDSWSESAVTGAAEGCHTPSAVLGPDGRLRIAIRANEVARRITLLVARVAVPTGPADWERTTLDLDAPVGPLQLAVRSDGLPVLAFLDGRSQPRVMVARARVPAATDWASVTAWPTGIGPFGFTLLRDRPVLLFRTEFPTDPNNGVRLAMASTTNPKGASDFRVMTLPRPVPESAFGGFDPVLAVHGGRLVGAHREMRQLKFVRATTDEPTAVSDFTITVADARAVFSTVSEVASAFATFQGRPMLTYQTDSEQRIAVARTSTPSGPDDWEIVSYTPHSTSFALLAIGDGPGRNAIFSAEWGGLSALVGRTAR